MKILHRPDPIQYQCEYDIIIISLLVLVCSSTASRKRNTAAKKAERANPTPWAQNLVDCGKRVCKCLNNHNLNNSLCESKSFPSSKYIKPLVVRTKEKFSSLDLPKMPRK